MRQRWNFGICLHRSTISTITAGLAREVCESCARVRVRYVEPAVKPSPDDEAWRAVDDRDDELRSEDVERRVFEARITFPESVRQLTCDLCDQPARFIVPDGLGCHEHAWQAAARLDWDEADPWVPIRIDRSNA